MINTMTKLKFSIVTLLLLVLLVATQAKKRSEEDHIMEIKPRRIADIPSNIRKCMEVKCGQGLQCFHGKCIKNDRQCANIRCQKGFRCKLGKCIKQQHEPKKMICPPINFKLQKQKCDRELLKQCRKIVINQDVCGFNRKTGKYYDYPSPCQACADRACDINFYFETTCDAAPRICSQDQQCLNGLCTDDFKNSVFENNRDCNYACDCKAGESCLSHKCVESKVLVSILHSLAQDKPIRVKI